MLVKQGELRLIALSLKVKKKSHIPFFPKHYCDFHELKLLWNYLFLSYTFRDIV